MTHDEAEFLISQRLDGTLDAADAERLRAAIDADAIVAAMWHEHQALDAALRGTHVAVGSNVEHEEQVARIAAAIDEHDEASSRTFKMPGFNWKTPLAAAAMVAVGLTIGILIQKSGDATTPGPTIAHGPSTSSTIEVAVAPPSSSVTTIKLDGSGDDIAVASGNPRGVVRISVGTPVDLTPAAVASLYAVDRFPNDRIVIEAAGRHPTYDVFD